MTGEEAFKLQKDYYKRYGTTMRGMMTEHGINPDDYLEFVHQIDHSPLEPNPALGAAIESLPGRKLILTNGTRKHADAVMKKLEIHQRFEDVFDIAAADLDPKPLPQVYHRFLAKHGVDPMKAAMFEDLARNLEVPHALGMTTVLVVPEDTKEVFREVWENSGRDAPHVDHVTDDWPASSAPTASTPLGGRAAEPPHREMPSARRPAARCLARSRTAAPSLRGQRVERRHAGRTAPPTRTH